MSDAKKPKTEDEVDLTVVEKVQQELEEIEEAFDTEVLKLQAQFNKKKVPLFNKRAAAIATIPGFWYQAFANHRVLEVLLHETDLEIWKYVVHLIVQEKEDVKSGFKITVRFKENPYIEDKELWKEFSFCEDGQTTISQSDVKWKAGMNPAQPGPAPAGGKKRPREGESFFSYFEKADVDHVDLANIIKDELWPNPIKYYLGEGDDDDFDSEDDEEDEEGEEEGEGEADGDGEE
eukprot:NODE_6154_length_875_cov_101.166223_g5923_i0.p1 GENE.NODE_6154_length_875_cov_101.166223_g5923_i0~~NODE_6154_length_875_cov_101.166223_g5923_i0.p1  ORF type:complete len:234 (+),score=68.02 NODE_6154_length_875_cov_101.166223_g5923_i0:79-780(+)